MIGWRLYQIWKFLLPDMDFNMEMSDNTFSDAFLNENFCIGIKYSLNLFLMIRFTIRQRWFR